MNRLSDNTQGRFLRGVLNGLSFDDACKAARVSPRRVRNQCAMDREFDLAVAKAEGLAATGDGFAALAAGAPCGGA